MNVADHSIFLIYPFKHDLDHAKWLGKFRRNTRLKALGARWRPWWLRLPPETLTSRLDDTYFFFPYLRNLLFPEIKGHLLKTQAAHVLASANQPLHVWTDAIHKDGVFRATLILDKSASSLPGRLYEIRSPHDNSSARFEIGWIDCSLFPDGVGFLLFAVRWIAPDGASRSPDCSELNELLYLLKTIQPPGSGFTLPEWSPLDGPEIRFTARSLVEYLLSGMVSGRTAVDETLQSFLQRTGGQPQETDYTMTATGQVYGEQFRRVVYACLSESSAHPATPSLFATAGDWQAYELATVSRVSDPDYLPREQTLHEFLAPRSLRFWDNWSGLATHDSATFIGERPTGLTLGRLKQQIESDYLMLYLLALYQYIRLSHLAGEIQAHRKSLRQNRRVTNKYWGRFIDFRNHYWFTEPTAKPQGTDIYHRFQFAMNLPAMFESIREELSELREYFEQKNEERIQCLLTVIAAASLLFAIFGADIATIDLLFCRFCGWFCLAPETPLGNI